MHLADEDDLAKRVPLQWQSLRAISQVAIFQQDNA